MSELKRDSAAHMARVETLRRLGEPWDDLECELDLPGSVDMQRVMARHSRPAPNGHGPAKYDRRQLAVVELSDVKPEPVPWLWEGWIARGALTVVTGHPDVGKSWLTLAVAAALTRGWTLYGDPRSRRPKQVLLVGAEDPLRYVVRPRLDSLGADPDLVSAIKGTTINDGPEQHFSLVDDPDLLDEEMALTHYELVVIDPLNAYLADTDTHRDAAVRSVLSPVAALAERRDVAVVALIHPTKGARDLPLYRIQGSVANSAACRTALLVGRDMAADGELSPKRHVVLLKNNLMPDEDKPAPLCFELTREKGFQWVGSSSATAARILNGGGDEEAKTLIEQAMDAIKEVLGDGRVEAKFAWREVKNATSASDRTINEAKARLRVEISRVGFGKGGQFFWSLPHRLQDQPIDCRAADSATNEQILQPMEEDAACPHTTLSTARGVTTCVQCGAVVET